MVPQGQCPAHSNVPFFDDCHICLMFYIILYLHNLHNTFSSTHSLGFFNGMDHMYDTFITTSSFSKLIHYKKIHGGREGINEKSKGKILKPKLKHILFQQCLPGYFIFQCVTFILFECCKLFCFDYSLRSHACLLEM